MWTVLFIIINLIHSNKRIHSATKRVIHWIIHSNDLLKHADPLSNETSDSLNHSLKRFTQTCWSTQQRNEWFIESFTQTIYSNMLIHSATKRVIHWIIHSNDLLKYADPLSNEMSDSLNHSLKWFAQICWSTQQRNEWFIESFTQMICSNMLIHSATKWVIHWIIHSNDLLKYADPLSNEMSDSLNHSIKWFAQTRWSTQQRNK